MFRVVPDQLRVSQGWVRCGNCDEVFDANASMQPDPGPAQNTSVNTNPNPNPNPSPSYSHDAVTVPGPMSMLEPSPAPSPAPSSVPAPVPAPIPAPAVALAEDSVPPPPSGLRIPSDDPFLHLSPHEPLNVDPVTSDASALPEELNISALGDVVPPMDALGAVHGDVRGDVREESPRYVQSESPAAPVDELSFMRKPATQTKLSRGIGKWLVIVMCVVASVGLAIQLILHERDYIAASQPALAPAINKLCDLAGCKVEPVRQIEALLIDSSAFAKVRADTYRLGFVLRNAAQIGVAVPAVELTLTDSMDQPVLRRVMLPSEFAGGKLQIGAGGELAVNLPLSIKSPDGVQKFSGYRLLAFYP